MQTHKILKVNFHNIPLQKSLSQELGISRVLAQVLINRGISSVPEAEQFLNTDLKDLLDPYLFSDMPLALGLIKKAVKNKDKVMIFGDYDVDGITSVVLLSNVLAKMGLGVVSRLPHRLKEGYGLNKDAVLSAKQKKIKLLITADCGISNHEQVKELRNSGIEVIITDHHEPAGVNLPPASGIINPKIKGSTYRYRDLAGVGVVYKLAQALTGKTLTEELDLVSLGTIADVVPLTGENRIIVKEGLSRLSTTKRVGLRSLIEASGLKKKKMNSTFVSYILAPRINASGRMDTAAIALDLLMSQDAQEADKLAQIIETHNRSRQKIENTILEEAQDLISKEINFKEHKVIVLAKRDWHQGVLGIVAAKLADRFYRPTILISLTENLCKGSGRSIKNFHLFDALRECQEHLETFGGHRHAVGLMIMQGSIEDFKHKINRLAAEQLKLEDLIPSLDVDMEIQLADLNERIIAELDRLEPFGTANPVPLFYTPNLKIKGAAQVLSRDTLKFWVSDGKITYQAIGFGMGSFYEGITGGGFFDLVYTPTLETWQGSTNILLEVQDIIFK